MATITLTGPSPVIFGASVANVTVQSINIDLSGNLNVQYGNPGNPAQNKLARIALNAGQINSVLALVEAAVQANENWPSLPTATVT